MLLRTNAVNFRRSVHAARDPWRRRQPSGMEIPAVSLFAMFGIGTTELLVLAGIALLLFGTRLPKVMRSLGQGIVEFKRGVQGIEDDGTAGRGDGAV